MWILLLALTLICARGWKEGRVVKRDEIYTKRTCHT